MSRMHKTRIAAAIAVGSLLLVPPVDAKKRHHKPPPPVKKGATYQGTTSQGDANCRFQSQNDQPCSVFAKVATTGKKVDILQVYFFAQCDDGKVFRSSTVFRNIPIKKGKYANESSYDESLSDGSTATNSVSTHGKFKRKGK